MTTDCFATSSRLYSLLLGAALACLAPAAEGLYINEIFYDPTASSGGVEERDEYIELRGEPNAPLDNHYLIFIENENNLENEGFAGTIENIFDMNGMTLGSNGFLVYRGAGQAGANDPSRYSVHPDATDLINTGTGAGYGSGDTSTIGASDLEDDGVTENGGFTAMIVHNVSGSAPELGFDLDVGNDGLDLPTGQEGWEILDAIGVYEARETLYGRTYAKVNYGVENVGDRIFFEGGIRTVDPGLEPDAVYYGVGYEIEHIARWGNSTGQTDDDWHIFNTTSNPGTGALSPSQLPDGAPIDWRMSRPDPHATSDGDPNTPPTQNGTIESTKPVPYGIRMTDNIGAPNYITGDYNGDGYVNAADFTVWRDALGETATEFAHHPADGNHDFVVDMDDYDLWVANFGSPGVSAPAPAVGISTPEPGSALLAVIGLAIGVVSRRSRD
ncbi:hypothetical protein Mal64_20000 [Pseudobythopirellula maris]|uniref:PEP-CTERM protein-sorting domain-containing protein n=1 Tax=Pseudobythopirellula maris TaxID=2527991 RepID=A0A5C5ZNM4_9BACT|nr:hypothetical protein [Pseudobythopirellula maris]TWT88517.1 hypothetical protein Mal64_20000 [Pseudobythopirellula maris]